MDPSLAAYHALIVEYLDSVLRMYRGERLINKIFGKVMQSHAVGRLVIMHYDAAAGAGPRPTVGRLQQAIGHSRTLAGFIALLRVASLVDAEPDPADRRLKYLVPSGRVIDGLRQWLAHQLACGERLGLGEPGFTARFMADDALFARYVRETRLVLDAVTRGFPQFPAMHALHQFDCGDRIVFGLLRAHHRRALETGPHAPPWWFAFSSGACAAELGVSRSHVRNVLNHAESLGLVEQDRTRRMAALAPAFAAEAHDWLMFNFGLFAEAGRRAARAAG